MKKFVIQVGANFGGNYYPFFLNKFSPQTSNYGASEIVTFSDEESAEEVAESLNGKKYADLQTGTMHQYIAKQWVHQMIEEHREYTKCPATIANMCDMAKISAEVMDCDAIYWRGGRAELYSKIANGQAEMLRLRALLRKKEKANTKLIVAFSCTIFILLCAMGGMHF